MKINTKKILCLFFRSIVLESLDGKDGISFRCCLCETVVCVLLLKVRYLSKSGNVSVELMC